MVCLLTKKSQLPTQEIEGEIGFLQFSTPRTEYNQNILRAKKVLAFSLSSSFMEAFFVLKSMVYIFALHACLLIPLKSRQIRS